MIIIVYPVWATVWVHPNLAIWCQATEWEWWERDAMYLAPLCWWQCTSNVVSFSTTYVHPVSWCTGWDANTMQSTCSHLVIVISIHATRRYTQLCPREHDCCYAHQLTHYHAAVAVVGIFDISTRANHTPTKATFVVHIIMINAFHNSVWMRIQSAVNQRWLRMVCVCVTVVHSWAIHISSSPFPPGPCPTHADSSRIGQHHQRMKICI